MKIKNLPSSVLNLLVRYKNIVLMGDFNHDISDINRRDTMNNFWSTSGLRIIHNYKFTHFDVVNNSKSLIDYFITNLDTVKYSNQFWMPVLSRHSFIYMVVDVSCNNRPNVTEYYDYKSTNMERLATEGPLWDFSSMYGTDDPNQMAIKFNEILTSKRDELVPRRLFYGDKGENGLGSALNSETIRRARVLANLAYRTYKTHSSTENWRCYCN